MGYVENMMAFLKQNNLNDKALDTFYLIACSKYLYELRWLSYVLKWETGFLYRKNPFMHFKL